MVPVGKVRALIPVALLVWMLGGCQSSPPATPTATPGMTDEEIAAEFAQVCRGEPVAAAGAALGPPHLAAVVANTDEALDDRTYVLTRWRARSVEMAQLVVCIDEAATELETCTYSSASGTTILGRTGYHVDVSVRQARSADVFESSQFQGPPPRACPAVIDRGNPPTLSERPTSEVQDWVDQIINPRFRAGERIGPPDASPFSGVCADAPHEPAGDGTRAQISTDAGMFSVELFTGSAPVATTNFLNLVSEGFYDGLLIDRARQELLIEGGDPAASGAEPVWYTIANDPRPMSPQCNTIDFQRGMVFTVDVGGPSPSVSHGSRFLVLLADDDLARFGSLLGRVVNGIDVVDNIGAMPTSGRPDYLLNETVMITSVVIEDGSPSR